VGHSRMAPAPRVGGDGRCTSAKAAGPAFPRPVRSGAVRRSPRAAGLLESGRSMKPVKVEEHRVASFDGTDLAYHVVGEGPPVLLANGLGGSWKAWTHQIAYFQDRYRFVSWDYRGLYRSKPPAARDALRVEDHAQDAPRVMDAAGVERTALRGWALGGPVAPGAARRAPA